MTSQNTETTQASYMAQHTVINHWRPAADKALLHLANTGRPFTNSDIRALVPPHLKPTHPNAWGGLISYWRHQGVIKACGVAAATTSARNGGLVRQWVGTHPNVARSAA